MVRSLEQVSTGVGEEPVSGTIPARAARGGRCACFAGEHLRDQHEAKRRRSEIAGRPGATLASHSAWSCRITGEAVHREVA